jgi:hypothetical protein
MYALAELGSTRRKLGEVVKSGDTGTTSDLRQGPYRQLELKREDIENFQQRLLTGLERSVSTSTHPL